MRGGERRSDTAIAIVLLYYAYNAMKKERSDTSAQTLSLAGHKFRVSDAFGNRFFKKSTAKSGVAQDGNNRVQREITRRGTSVLRGERWDGSGVREG